MAELTYGNEQIYGLDAWTGNDILYAFFCGEHGLLTQAQKYRHVLLIFCIQNLQIAVST